MIRYKTKPVSDNRDFHYPIASGFGGGKWGKGDSFIAEKDEAVFRNSHSDEFVSTPASSRHLYELDDNFHFTICKK